MAVQKSDPQPVVEKSPTLQRETVSRSAYAKCQECSFTSRAANALSQGTRHAEKHGHKLFAEYSAAYFYNPVEPA